MKKQADGQRLQLERRIFEQNEKKARRAFRAKLLAEQEKAFDLSYDGTPGLKFVEGDAVEDADVIEEAEEDVEDDEEKMD